MTNHGTAVLGEVGSLNNASGTTGIAYGSAMYVVPTNTANGWNIAGAITTATGTLTAGDVIIIEQQYVGPNYTGIPAGTQNGLVPVEWEQGIYNAIVTAVGNGIIVVEAAGNGAENLDDPVYGTGNGGHWPFLPGNDSGAIIVGAGARPGGSDVERSRLGFSNYGSTLDLQGWGEGVYTTGYGNAYSAEGKNLWFTSTFSGTSSASPIVAGAALLLQSTYRANQGFFLTPAQVKTYLQNTGSPQQSGTYPSSQNIGPLPNVTAALVQAIPSLDSNFNGVPDTCESSGLEACCFSAGGCSDLPPSICLASNGTPQGISTSCATTICQIPFQACCFPSGTCSELEPSACTFNGGTPQGTGTTCFTANCQSQQNQSCCLPGGNCSEMNPAACTSSGGTPQGVGSHCSTTFCQPQNQACCLPSGMCSDMSPANCTSSGGTPQGFGTNCFSNPCPAPTGACCSQFGCAIQTFAQCQSQGGQYQGDGSNCQSAGPDFDSDGIPDTCDFDDDNDGVPDTSDVCPNTRPGLPVNCDGRPLRDANNDCLVNGADLQIIVNELLGA